jgi:hypothetical protein
MSTEQRSPSIHICRGYLRSGVPRDILGLVLDRTCEEPCYISPMDWPGGYVALLHSCILYCTQCTVGTPTKAGATKPGATKPGATKPGATRPGRKATEPGK